MQDALLNNYVLLQKYLLKKTRFYLTEIKCTVLWNQLPESKSVMQTGYIRL